ncbi:MAG: zinc ribbon domain-containing protein [Candidatus Edwardsbacteria bacterium]|nr:zinc ribbon domain-containing protein [Candidatus Edwardsbacteria bacterium]
MPAKPLTCQSCGKPLERPADHGTEAGGAPSSEYCSICYKQGTFTQPAVTMEQMIEKTANVMAIQIGIPQPKAKELVGTYMPKLKRWKQ